MFPVHLLKPPTPNRKENKVLIWLHILLGIVILACLPLGLLALGSSYLLFLGEAIK